MSVSNCKNAWELKEIQNKNAQNNQQPRICGIEQNCTKNGNLMSMRIIC